MLQLNIPSRTEGEQMRDLTIHELDAELAEQLPTREFMGVLGRGFLTNVGLHHFIVNQYGNNDTGIVINITIIVGNHNVINLG